MKKVSLIMCAIAMMSVCFTSCKKEPEPIPEIIENGFYVVGEATGFADLSASGVSVCQMAAGKNEVTKALREGMYEKYIVLEGGKEFKLLKKQGELIPQYTASLEPKNLTTDGVDIEGGYWGAISEGTAAMKVEKTGLYHIVLDLNLDKQLDAAGGAQIVIAPVTWGVRGAMNGWGYTQYTAMNQEGTSWSWKDQELSAGAEFKFAYGQFWKINLDAAEQVKAEVSLGKDMVSGGENIKVEEGGVYEIVLSFKMAKGDIKNSFTMELKKGGELVLDPATFVVGISGTMNGWGDPSGTSLAKYDAESSKVDDPATKAGTYVYKMASMTFPAESQFKFRVKGDWLGLDAVTEATGVTLEEKDGNIAGVEGTFDIVLTLVWDGEKIASLKAAFTPGTPLETKNIKVTAKNIPAEWQEVAIYAWNGQGNLCGDWPGTVVAVANGVIVHEFKDVVPPINVIFNNNGGGAQTKDMTDISDDTEIDVTANLK
jgi:hypothetical protein